VNKILIAGGNGLLGRLLAKHFARNGFEVNILSRERRSEKNFYLWNPAHDFLEEESLRGVSCVINLAGVSLAEGRWTRIRKQEIVSSRIQSTEFLFNKLKSMQHTVNTFISASAIGYYGTRHDELVDESFSAGEDFLASCCRHWEDAAQKISSLGIRTVIFRTGVVLSKDGGALPLLALPAKLFVAAPVGSGKQYISWIHHADLCSMFLKAVQDHNIRGIYNAVSPGPVTNRNFMKTLAGIFYRPFFLPAVPSAVLKIVLGEKAITITGGQNVSSKKIQDTGIAFQFPELKMALENIYAKSR
jgi:uncharacterized protein (TIGR01777 family)